MIVAAQAGCTSPGARASSGRTVRADGRGFVQPVLLAQQSGLRSAPV